MAMASLRTPSPLVATCLMVIACGGTTDPNIVPDAHDGDVRDAAAGDIAAPDAPPADTAEHDDGPGPDPDTRDDSANATDPTAIAMIEIAVADMTFDARAAGPRDGELVLLLHGFPQTSHAWRHQLGALAAAGYRAVAFDQRGYSPRARPPGVAAYGLPLLVADVTAAASALGAERFHLVGHDWGAAVAWAVAALHPERVATLSALSVPHPAAYETARLDPESCQAAASGYIDLLVREGAEDTLLAGDAAGLRLMWQGLDAASIEAYLAALGTPEALGAALAWYRANLGPDAPGLAADIGLVSTPTLFLWGDRDPAVCRDGPDATAAWVTGPYRFEVMTGQGHWLPELAAEAVSALIVAHISTSR